MATKKLVHDLDVCFKRLLVKPSMVHIRETQMLMVALTGRFVVALTGPCGCDMPGLKPLLVYSRCWPIAVSWWLFCLALKPLVA